MFNKPDDYVFSKIKGKIDLVQNALEKTGNICEFAMGQELSPETFGSLKKDVAAQLRKAAGELEEAIMFSDSCDCTTGQGESS